MSKKITVACSECNDKNYRMSKTMDERMSIKKFCKKCNKHTLHKEEK